MRTILLLCLLFFFVGCKDRQVELDKKLLSCPASIAWQSNSGVVDLILEGADINAQDQKGKNILLKICEKNQLGQNNGIIKYIVEKTPVKIDLIDVDGNTALIYAVKSSSFETVKLLLLHDANVNIANNEKYTALHYSIMESLPEDVNIIEVLLNSECDINAVTIYGETVLDLAYKFNSELVDFLRKHGAKTNEELKIMNSLSEHQGKR